MNTRRVKPGDIVYVQTKSERGHALVEHVVDGQPGHGRRLIYTPLAGDWQRGRFRREPATARQITDHWSHRTGGNA